MGRRDAETPRGRRVGVELSVAHIDPLLRGAVLRERDLARAAKAEKVGFSADIEGYFFIFRNWGGARAGGCGGSRDDASGFDGGLSDRLGGEAFGVAPVMPPWADRESFHFAAQPHSLASNDNGAI